MTKDLFQRRGTFKITRQFLDDLDDQQLFQLFSGIIVLRAEDKLWDKTVEYFAVSPAFDLIAEGFICPEYEVSGHITEEGTQMIAWEKV